MIYSPTWCGWKEYISKFLQRITFLCGLFWIIALTSDGKNKCSFSGHNFLLHYTLPSFNQASLIFLTFLFSWNLRIDQSCVNIDQRETGFKEMRIIWFWFFSYLVWKGYYNTSDPIKCHCFPGEHLIFTRTLASSWAESCKSFCLVSISVIRNCQKGR